MFLFADICSGLILSSANNLVIAAGTGTASMDQHRLTEHRRQEEFQKGARREVKACGYI
jgi:hypothetical protein